MYFKAFIKWCFLIFNFINISYAQQMPIIKLEPNKIINIENIFKDFENFNGQFNQVQFSIDKNNKTLKGDFSFSQPNKFKWNYIKPMQQLIQSDGKNLYIYDKDLQQISIKKVDEALNNSPIAIFFNAKNWHKQFSSNIITNSPLKEFSNLNYWIELIPKAQESVYKSIYIGLDNKQGKYMPKIISFNDNLGNKGYIELYNLQKQNFKSEYFNFEIPKGVDVIQ